MKKYLIATLAIVMAMTACRRTMYNEEVPPQAASTTDAAETGAPAAIELGSNLQANVETKSLGALDDWINDSQKLYIFGISRVQSNNDPASAVEDADLDLAMDPQTQKYPGILINNVLAQFPGDFDNTKDQEKQKVNVFNPDGQGDEPEPFYYNESKRYEFFGYYVDDAVNGTPAPTIDADNITLPIIINGAQDIMLATTDKLDDNTADINPNRLYSAYSSRKGIRPNLIFKHQLSRFNVWVKSGDDATLTGKMHIETLSFETETQGTLYIANKAQATTAPYLEVTEGHKSFIGIWHGSQGFSADGEEEKRLDSSLEAANKYTYNPTTSWTKAGTLLVMPGEREYKIKVGLTQTGYSGPEVIANYTINFADLVKPSEDPKGARSDENYVPDAKAEAGHQYDVNIIVYGLQEIEITVTMSEWKDAGSFVVDQDSDDEVAIAIAQDANYVDDPNYDKDYQGDANHPLVMEVGDHINLAPTAESNFTSITSSNGAVATVTGIDDDVKGVVTAVAPGDAKIILKAAPILEGEHRRPEGGYRVVNVHVNGTPAQNPTDITVAANAMDANLVFTYGGDNFSLHDPTVGPAEASDAVVTYAVTTGAAFISQVGEATSKEFSITGAGDAVITITAHKEGNFNEGTTTVNVKVNKADQSFTLERAAVDFTAATAANEAVEVNAVEGPGIISVQVEGGNGHVSAEFTNGVITISTTDDVEAGTDNCTVHVTKDGNDNYNVLVKDITVTIQ